MWKKLQLRFERVRDGLIHDICDGSEYKKKCERWLFIKGELLCNTEGVQVFTSSKRKVWPIWLDINELPPNLK